MSTCGNNNLLDNKLKLQVAAARAVACGLASAILLFTGSSQVLGDDSVAPSASRAFHVFLLVGQSNMAGRATIEAEDATPIDRALLWNIAQKKWEPAKPPYNRYSLHAKQPSMQRLNPGPSFVREYLKANPDVTVGIVCAARGGTTIEQWEKGKTKPWPLFDAAVQATNDALSAGGKLKGILWHQGEGNSGAARVSAYPAQLKQLITNFRAAFGKPDLPFVFAQIGQFNSGYSAFNKMIVKQPAVIPHTACVVTDELTNMDHAHFDSASQRILGQRYAKAMLRLLNSATTK